MPAPPCASCHASRAALRRPRSGQALCGACFCAAFEAEVLHTVLAGRLLPPGAVVAVGASGGKDSTVLAHVLRALTPRLGISLQLVAVDEGIGGYRDVALAAVRRQAARWELPLTVVAYEDLFGGWTMDAVARSTAGSGRSRSCCTFCGVLRRRALEEGARRVGATHIVTGEYRRGAERHSRRQWGACTGEEAGPERGFRRMLQKRARRPWWLNPRIPVRRCGSAHAPVWGWGPLKVQDCWDYRLEPPCPAARCFIHVFSYRVFKIQFVYYTSNPSQSRLPTVQPPHGTRGRPTGLRRFAMCFLDPDCLSSESSSAGRTV
ncbi:cytoplasmic tRNA 2-thiolation protein 1 isoform X2 [Macaca mulatta]